jgi:hypothetical protein
MAKIINAYELQNLSGVMSNIDPEFKSDIADITDYRRLEEVVSNDFKIAAIITLTYQPSEMTTWDIARGIASAGISWKRMDKNRVTHEFKEDSGQTKVFFRTDKIGELKLLRIEGNSFFGIKGPITEEAKPGLIPEAQAPLEPKQVQREVWQIAQDLRDAYETGNITGFMQQVHDNFSAEGIPNKDAFDNAIRLDFRNMRDRTFSEWSDDGFIYQAEEQIAVQRIRWKLRFFEGTSTTERLMEGTARFVFKQGSWKLYHIEGNKKADLIFGAWSDPVKQQTEIPGGGYIITAAGKKTVDENDTVVIQEGEVASSTSTSTSTGTTSKAKAGTRLVPGTISRQSEGDGPGWNFSTNSPASSVGSSDIIYGSADVGYGFLWRKGEPGVIYSFGCGADFSSVAVTENLNYHESVDLECQSGEVLAVHTRSGKFIAIKVTNADRKTCAFEYYTN